MVRAEDFSLSLRTVGQGYQERRYGPSGAAELLSRRRLTQYINLSVFHLEPERWRGDSGDRNAISFEMALRLDSDFGRFMLDRPIGSDAIGELQQNQIDVLYAYVAGRELGNRVSFQLGRQVHFDRVDFYAFDGASLVVRAARRVAVEAFGGTEVRGELPLSSPLYELDGTSVGARDPATRPRQQTALRPMVGAALLLDDITWLRARLGYRRAFSSTVDPRPGDPSYGVNHESVGLTADADWRNTLFLMGGARFNRLVAAFDDQQVAVRGRLGARQMLALEYSYLAPTFDGDSIWNVFGAGAFRDFRAAYDLDTGWGWRLHARGFWRTFVDPPGLLTETRALSAAAGQTAYGGTLGADTRVTRGRARADLYAETGQGGWKIGGDAAARWVISPGELDLEGRFTMYAWRPDAIPDARQMLMAGIQAGAIYQMSRRMRLHFLAENNSGTTYRAQLRGLAILEVDVAL